MHQPEPPRSLSQLRNNNRFFLRASRRATTGPRGWKLCTTDRGYTRRLLGVIPDSRGAGSPQSGSEGAWFGSPRGARAPPRVSPPPSQSSGCPTRFPSVQPSLRRPRLAFPAAAAPKFQPRRAPAVHSSSLGVGVGNSWGAPGKRELGWEGAQQGGL